MFSSTVRGSLPHHPLFRNRSNLELEQQVQERTAQLQERCKELQELNQLKDDFLGTVSHELRTPVTNIKVAIRMLSLTLQTSGGDRVSEGEVIQQRTNKLERYLKVLEDECNREIGLINNLLDLQRLEFSPQILIFENVSLHDWLLRTVEPFEERARNRQQTLKVNVHHDILPISSNLSNLERILAELLNNACKYTPPMGEITVHLYQERTTPTEQERTTRLIVHNTGSQIPASELDCIFEKFYRVPSADPWRQGGTGLGLALVKKLVQQLGGKVWAESEASQTSFTVELPNGMTS